MLRITLGSDKRTFRFAHLLVGEFLCVGRDLSGMIWTALDTLSSEVIQMAKQGMKRPERTHTQPKNEVKPVPEIQGKAKSGKAKAKPAPEV
jgi:hypothetical protein